MSGYRTWDTPVAMPNLESNPAELTLEDYFRKLDRSCGGEIKAKDKQVAGTHYQKSAMQPWDIISEWELDFWEGNVLKYLLRWKYKDGVQDLKKALHYLEYLIEREEQNGKAS